MGPYLWLLAGVKEANLFSEQANMTSRHLPSQFQTLPTTLPLPREPDSQHAAPHLSPQGATPFHDWTDP